ncbi:MAG: hypothetical protein U5L76_05865 [Patescibacteria group bacterium]|nr:hypothetical protein [Patescibacteria group bacterium]
MVLRLKKLILSLLLIFVLTFLLSLVLYGLAGQLPYNLCFKIASGVTFVYGLIYIIKIIGGKEEKKESYAIIKTKTKAQRIFYSLLFYSLIYAFIWGLLTD